jgi:hypothetical protein
VRFARRFTEINKTAIINKTTSYAKREFDEAKIILRNSSRKTLQIQNTTEYKGNFFKGDQDEAINALIDALR